MTDKPMSDADFLRDLACDMRDSAPVYADRLIVIAKRLEKIDAPKFVIPLHYFQACSDAGVPITWVVDEENPT